MNKQEKKMASFVCMASSFRIYCNVAFYQKKNITDKNNTAASPIVIDREGRPHILACM